MLLRPEEMLYATSLQTSRSIALSEPMKRSLAWEQTNKDGVIRCLQFH